MSYVDEIKARVREQNPSQPEFNQAVEEVLESVRAVVERNEERYRREALLERLTMPERNFTFTIPGWTITVMSRSTVATVCSSTAPSALTRAVCASIPL